MRIKMRNKRLVFSFALSAMVSALIGCGGGESANIKPEKYNNSTISGSCTPGKDSNCFEFALDYPFQGLNFYCGADTSKTYSTMYNENEGIASGACKAGDTVKFFISGVDKKIEIGSYPLTRIGHFSVNQLPRLTLKDLSEANQLGSEKLAIRLIKIMQAIALQHGNAQSPQDIQKTVLENTDRVALDSIKENITTADFLNATEERFIELIEPWIDISIVSDIDARAILDKLTKMSNAAVYQPEFALFSTSDWLGDYLSGSQGVVGCDVAVCDPKNSNITHTLSHFMLMTDREGKTFGSGVQWRGKIQGTGSGTGLETIAGVNIHLIKNTRPIRLTGRIEKTNWLDPITKALKNTDPFILDTDEDIPQEMEIYQGTLKNDYMIAGTEKFYKLLTGSKNVNTNELGAWRQKLGASQTFSGSMDIYKIFPITHLDSKVFKTIDNVAVGENYLFPMYGDLTFKFTDSTVPDIKLGIVIKENGDIRTNFPRVGGITDIQRDMSTEQYNNDSCKDGMLEGISQYSIGTVSRVFTNNNKISLRLILAGEDFGDLNGALVGLNSNIKISENSTVVIGGALINMEPLLNANQGIPSANIVNNVTLQDSSNSVVKWANSFASFNQVYSSQFPNDNTAKETAKLSGGEVSFKLASCYSIKTKQ